MFIIYFSDGLTMTVDAVDTQAARSKAYRANRQGSIVDVVPQA